MKYFETEYESKSLKRVFAMVSSVIALTFAAPYVAAAYSLQLVNCPLPTVSTTMKSLAGAGEVIRLVQQAPIAAPHSKVMLGRLLTVADMNRFRLLWSMYPASVRGRVFGAKGGDPTMGGGW